MTIDFIRESKQMPSHSHTHIYIFTHAHTHSLNTHTPLTVTNSQSHTHTVTHTRSVWKERFCSHWHSSLISIWRHTSLCSVADVTDTITAVLYLIFQRPRDAGGFSLLNAPHRVVCYLGRRPNLQQIQNYLSFCSFAKNKWNY